MKTILTLTDFTDNATHAAQTATIFAEKTHANLLLYHCLQSLPVTAYAGGPWVTDELTYLISEGEERLVKLAEQLAYSTAHRNVSLTQPIIYHQAGEGNLGNNVRHICEQKNIALIVMGARGDSVFEHLLFGSETMSVLKQAIRPVLIMPKKSDLKQINRVLFATDFAEADMEAIYYLVNLSEVFGFQLEIAHIIQPHDQKVDRIVKEIDFKRLLAGLKHPEIIYQEFEGRDVVHRLKHLCNEKQPDILAVMHRQQSFFTRLLQKSVTKQELSGQAIPMMVFPATMSKPDQF